jgi:hypothetical protein
LKKTKSIIFSRKNPAIASRPRLDIWIKRTKIEQVRKYKILGLIFDTRMNWNEHILSTKAKEGKNEHHLMLGPHQMAGRPRKSSHNTQNDNTKHLKIRRRGLRLSIQSSVKKSQTNPQPRNKIGTGMFAVCRTEDASASTLADKRNRNTTITAIRFICNPNHPIRPYCLNPTNLDEYELPICSPKSFICMSNGILRKTTDRHQKERKNAHHSILDHHGRTSTITDSIANYAQSDEAQATKGFKLKLFAFSPKSTNITAKYTKTDRKKY